MAALETKICLATPAPQAHVHLLLARRAARAAFRR